MTDSLPRLSLLFALSCSVMITQAGQRYQLLHSFSGGDGSYPVAKLVLGRDGALYGTTYWGGVSNQGTVFRIDKDGGYRVLWKFGSFPGDGANPWAEVLEASDGALYGTTTGEGSNTNGSIFKIQKDGSGFAVLYSSNAPQRPYSGLIEGSYGVLYGTTTISGGRDGTVFRVNKDGGDYRVLFDQLLCNQEFFWPQAALIQGSDGVLYGTSQSSPLPNYYYDGFIFRLGEDGTGYGVLHQFGDQPTNSIGLKSALLEASDGALYGVIRDQGTMFRINRDGTDYRALYHFGSDSDLRPSCQLIEGIDGALYGTTGAQANPGTVFRINKDGTDHTILHLFGEVYPQSGLAKGSDGAFYGTTSRGGDADFGTIYKIWPPQTPDVAATLSNSTPEIIVSGMSGYNYQVLRSVDFSNWCVLTNFSMASSGTYTFADANPPPERAYYRAAWAP